MKIYHHTFLKKFREINLFANQVVQESEEGKFVDFTKKNRLQIEEYNPNFFILLISRKNSNKAAVDLISRNIVNLNFCVKNDVFQ